MEAKIVEIRDRMTLIPAIAICINGGDHKLLKMAGYGARNYIALFPLNCNRGVNYDPFSWGDRTLTVAHQHIQQEWENLNSGDVIDVQHILGETDEKVTSDCL